MAFENFLTQNEAHTDSLVESALGNDMALSFSEIGVQTATVPTYSLEQAKNEIQNYRGQVFESKTALSGTEKPGNEELVTILDDVTELCSKTLYHLKLK